jgi:hypothetical protein
MCLCETEIAECIQRLCKIYFEFFFNPQTYSNNHRLLVGFVPGGCTLLVFLLREPYQQEQIENTIRT